MLTINKQASSSGIQSIDQEFQGFKLGDFAILHRHPFCKTLAFRLCVHCQLPKEEGGLASSAIYVDGGNTFNPYAISAIAREFGLNPRSALEQVFVSRAFTAYQLSAIILETLEDALKRYKSKLVLISNITSLFLDRDVPNQESFVIFNKVITRLSDLALRRNIITVATCFNNESSRRQNILESILLEKTRTIAEVTELNGRLQLTIQNSDFPKPLKVDILQNRTTLEKFMEA
ncbi:MAG TPA: hypothetical protein VJ249_06730 [Candidatus Bathyarchaeia archaeon]|nr:hypothetical protein [Candidatus Bathyarchaeia archaeon]